jgi:acyl carrier protein
MPNPASIPSAVTDLLVDLLSAGPDGPPDPRDWTGTAGLRELGVDSLMLVRLISGLEARFEIMFDNDDLLPDNFLTVGTVTALVERCQGTVIPAAQATGAASATPQTAAAATTSGAEAGDTVEWWPQGIEAQLLYCTARPTMSPEHVRRALSLLRSTTPRLDWGVFLDLASRHRVLGLVARSFDRECLGPLGTVRRSTLRAPYLYNRGRAQAWERERRELFAAFTADGVSPVVRKGSYLSEYIYPDPAMRYMEDMDLYVTGAEADLVIATLQRLGYRQGSDSKDRRTVDPLDRETEVFWQLNVAAMPPFLRPTSDPYVDVFSVDLRRDLMEPASG